MRGAALFVLLLLTALFWHDSRRSHPARVEIPAVLPSTQHVVTFVLDGDGVLPGVYQFYDAGEAKSVMKLTDAATEGIVNQITRDGRWPSNGETLRISQLEDGALTVTRFWMSATQRSLLGIPLHPDQMSVADWEALPGIGPKLAAAIEADRQKNGDFGSFEALDRVKGIGPKKMAGWRGLFIQENNK